MINKDALTAHIRDMEQRQQIKRVLDFCEQSIRSYSVRHTKFLTPNQIQIIDDILPQIKDISYRVVKPTKTAERQLIYFYPPYMDFDEIETDFAVLKMVPCQKDEELGHRDVLGSIMSLGIERENIGDILIDKRSNEVFVILLKPFDSYLLTDLCKIRNTKVIPELCDKIPDVETELEEEIINVASMRLDGVVSSLAGLSREKSQRLIQSGDVKVNYVELKENSKQLCKNDVISIRKFGKFRVGDLLSETKKKRFRVQVFRYKN